VSGLHAVHQKKGEGGRNGMRQYSLYAGGTSIIASTSLNLPPSRRMPASSCNRGTGGAAGGAVVGRASRGTLLPRVRRGGWSLEGVRFAVVGVVGSEGEGGDWP
jgi:hypothetical protein